MQKQTKPQQLPKLIMAVTLIVMLGALFGAVGWLINYWATAPIHYVKPQNDFCKSFKLEECDGKRVSIIGLVDYIPKGLMGIITDIQDRDAEYKWAGGIFLMKNGHHLNEEIKAGSIVSVIGIIQKGGQPCGSPERPEQCLAPFHATQIEVESLKVIEEREVVISTDKTEYEQEKTVKITVRNNFDKSIWYFSNSYLSLRLLGYQNNNWVNVPMLPTAPLPSGYIPQISELKTGEAITLEYNPGAYIDKNFLNYSKYKMSFKIKDSKKSDLNYADLIYSNEFTIKEKSAVDPRCGQKVKFDPNCARAVVVYGYEFDSVAGKCKEVNTGGGCNFETPFNSLEECRKVCESNK